MVSQGWSPPAEGPISLARGGVAVRKTSRGRRSRFPQRRSHCLSTAIQRSTLGDRYPRPSGRGESSGVSLSARGTRIRGPYGRLNQPAERTGRGRFFGGRGSDVWQLDRGAWRQTAFLRDAALRAEDELVKMAGDPVAKLLSQPVDNFAPLQAAAIDQTVGGFDRLIWRSWRRCGAGRSYSSRRRNCSRRRW